MNHFTIKDIENLCGIKAHTLRTWEKRYGLATPKRRTSKHRTYDNDDLKNLLRISFLYHQGYKISKIASLSTAEIDETVSSTCVCEKNHELFVQRLMEAGLDFDKERFEKIMNSLVLCMGFDKSVSCVFFPFLQRIGLLWLTNNVIPAQEHFVSHIIRKKIICATDALGQPPNGKAEVIVFAPTGEFHEIPLLVANYFFRKHKRRTSYFGPNVSLECLKYYTKHHDATILYCHVITSLDNGGLDKYLCELCSEFPDKQVILSGPAGDCLEKKPSNLQRILSLDEMIRFTVAPVPVISA